MIVPVFLPHLGCSSRCIYCDQVNITDVRKAAVGETVRESLAPVTGPVEVGLYGGDLFGLGIEDLKRLFAWFEPFREKISSFRISTRPVPFNEEKVQFLKDSGVGTIELGMPSFNDAILHTLNRRHTVADLVRTFYRLKEKGFTTALQVMVGLPGESMADIRETAERLSSLKPDYVRIYPLAVLSGTPLEAMWREGRFIPPSFEDAVVRALHIYLTSLREGLKVIKMGLTENEVIEDRVTAGTFHPAFGYVVKTWAFRLAVLSKVRTGAMKGSAVVRLNKRDVPHLVGLKRDNLARFREEGVEISWEEGATPEGSFLLVWEGGETQGDIYDALTMIPS